MPQSLDKRDVAGPPHEFPDDAAQGGEKLRKLRNSLDIGVTCYDTCDGG